MEEFYFLQNTSTKLFLKGFATNKPLWVDNKDDAVSYKEMDALRIQRRLENLYKPYQKIILVES